MKKLAIVLLAVVLCAFMCVSCAPEKKDTNIAGHIYSQSYASTEGKFRYQWIEFTTSKIFAYNDRHILMEKGDYVISGNSLKIYWDDDSRSTFSFRLKYGTNDYIVIDGYTFNRTDT